jgi:hypothetical protein
VRNAKNTTYLSTKEAEHRLAPAVDASTEIVELDNLVAPTTLEHLHALDLDAHFVLVVFQGWKSTIGYGVRVDRITRRGDTVTVYARFREPKPDEEKGAMVTSPYHLIQIQKVGTWSRDITFNLVVDEAVVASLSRYIP